MDDISGKFRAWLSEKDKWGLLQPRAEMCHDTLEIGFFYGYTIAQKDLQQKLDTYIQLAHTKSAELDEAIGEFKKCYKALEFFHQHADCRTNKTYYCSCNFCKDREHNVLRINARAYLEKWK